MFCALLLLLLPGASSLFAPRALSRRTVVMNDGLSRRRAFQGLAVGGFLLGKDAVAEEDDGIFRPAAGSMAGQRVLITGGNVGLGLETAKRLKAAGADVVVTARSAAKVDGALETLKAVPGGGSISGVVLDLASLDSIATLKKRLDISKLDVVINNAGVMAIPARETTADGFERQIGINFLGHYALTCALLPSLMERKQFRVVNVASAAHELTDGAAIRGAIDADLDPSYSQWGNYCISKALNVAFSAELQRRLDSRGVSASVVSLHPGVVQTDLARYLLNTPETTAPVSEMGPVQRLGMRVLRFFVLPVEAGANTQVFLASGADSGGDLSKHGALYYDKMAPAKALPAAMDAVIGADLFKVAERLTGLKCPI